MDASDDAVAAFREAVTQLSSFATASQRPLGPNFGVAMAVLLHRSDPGRFVIPPYGDATTTGDLQLKVCDPTWAKAPEFLPSAESGPIHKPFTLSFKGRSPAVNNWRNSFDIQGGIGCSAPYTSAYLQSAAYVAEHRFDCSFRDGQSGYCRAANTGALCFNPTKKGGGVAAWSDTSARPRPKLLRRGTDSHGTFGYWSVEPTVDSLADLLGDPLVRVPVTAFATVLFAGSPYWSKWGEEESASRLQKLLALDDELFFTVFEGKSSIVVGPTAPASEPSPSTVTQGEPISSVESATESTLVGTPPRIPKAWLGTPVDYVDRDTAIVIERAGRESDPERRRRLLENATQGHRRVLNVLAKRLRDNGFAVDEQPGGYDLHAFDGEARHILFEAKTWTPANLASQVRSGWAQLEEYAFRNRESLGDSPELALVLNHQPPADYWAWQWFRTRNAPFVLWIDEGDVETFKHHTEWLTTLVGEAPTQSSTPSLVHDV